MHPIIVCSTPNWRSFFGLQNGAKNLTRWWVRVVSKLAFLTIALLQFSLFSCFCVGRTCLLPLEGGELCGNKEGRRCGVGKERSWSAGWAKGETTTKGINSAVLFVWTRKCMSLKVFVIVLFDSWSVPGLEFFSTPISLNVIERISGNLINK